MFEATLIRVIGLLCVAQMPLADHRSLVARRLERLGHEMFVRVDTRIRPRHDHRVGNTETNRITAGHQRGTSGRADGCRVEASEFDALFRQTVQGGRIDRSAVISHVGPAEIVGQHDDDVGTLVSVTGGRQQSRQREQNGE